MHRHHQQHLLHHHEVHHEVHGPLGDGTAGPQQGSLLDATLMLASMEPRTGTSSTAPRIMIRKRLRLRDRTAYAIEPSPHASSWRRESRTRGNMAAWDTGCWLAGCAICKDVTGISRLSLRQVIGIPVRLYPRGAQTRIRAMERLGLPRFVVRNTQHTPSPAASRSGKG